MSKININELILQLENDAMQSTQREMFCSNARQTANNLKSNIDNLKQMSLVALENTKNVSTVMEHMSNLANVALENRSYDVTESFNLTRYDMLNQINSWYLVTNPESQTQPYGNLAMLHDRYEGEYDNRFFMKDALKRHAERKRTLFPDDWDPEMFEKYFSQNQKNAGNLVLNTITDMNNQLTSINKFVDEKCSQNTSQNLEHLQNLKSELQKMNDDNITKQANYDNMKKQIDDAQTKQIYDNITKIVNTTIPIMQLATKMLNRNTNCNNSEQF